MAKTNYTKPMMRKRLVAKYKAGSKGGKAGQWSARKAQMVAKEYKAKGCLLYTSPSPRDVEESRMPSSA